MIVPTAFATLALCLQLVSSASVNRATSDSDNFETYVIHGRNATSGEVPHQVALFVNGTFHECGGSLISPRTVVSAAHCVVVNQHRPQDFSIRYGSTDISKGEDIKVVKVIAHPLFTESRLDYDISVLHLEKPFQPSSRAKAIPMAKTDPADGAHVSISGWGMRNISSSAETRFLQFGDSIRVVNRSACNSTWHSLIPITERMLCAGSTTQAFCHGDSGSGAVSVMNQVPTLVGVVSFSIPSCDLSIKQPSVFADVAHLRGWIEANSAK